MEVFGLQSVVELELRSHNGYKNLKQYSTDQ